jgi:dTDP-4-dehydrorhamnose reductase
MAAVGDCVREPERAADVNINGTATLTELCNAAGARLVFVSTDLVFDGEAAPYAEDARKAPLSVYGRTKAVAEDFVLKSGRHAVVRVSLLYGPSRNGKPNFFDAQVAALRDGQPVRLFHDEWRTPLALSSAARAITTIAQSDVTGLMHAGGPERMSRLEMGRRLADHLGVSPAGIEAASRLDPGGEPRPRDTSLDSTRWRKTFPEAPWASFVAALTEMGVR